MIIKIVDEDGAATVDWLIVELQGFITRPAATSATSLDGLLIGKLTMKPVGFERTPHATRGGRGRQYIYILRHMERRFIQFL